MEKFNQIIQFVQEWFKRMPAEQKRLLALVCTVIFSGLLTYSVIMSLRGPGEEKIPSEPEGININSPIPPEELFLPDEPDYLPGVLLEREQRTSWTTEDASSYWQDPLKFGEEQWREKIEAAIDEFLERVP